VRSTFLFLCVALLLFSRPRPFSSPPQNEAPIDDPIFGKPVLPFFPGLAPFRASPSPLLPFFPLPRAFLDSSEKNLFCFPGCFRRDFGEFSPIHLLPFSARRLLSLLKMVFSFRGVSRRAPVSRFLTHSLVFPSPPRIVPIHSFPWACCFEPAIPLPFWVFGSLFFRFSRKQPLPFSFNDVDCLFVGLVRWVSDSSRRDTFPPSERAGIVSPKFSIVWLLS